METDSNQFALSYPLNASHRSPREKKIEKRRESITLSKEHDNDQFDSYSPLDSVRERLPKQVNLKNDFPVFIFHPFEPLRIRWDLFIALIMIYMLITVPPKICFQIDGTSSDPLNVVELVIDAIFFIDIIINFHTGHTNADDVFINDKRTIAIAYLKGWFWVDLITTLPFTEVLSAFVGSKVHTIGPMSKALKAVRIIRLLKILRIFKLMLLMSKWSGSDTDGNETAKQLLSQLLIILLVTHTVACGFIGVETFYRVSSLADSPEDNFGYNEYSWFVRFQSTAHRPIHDQYLRSLYWAFTTLTTVGYGDITPLLPLEIIYTIFTQILGSTIFGFTIGNVASIMVKEKESVVAIKEKISAVNFFLQFRRVPEELCAKIQRHFEYSWKRNQVFRETEILADLPSGLRVQCALYIHKEIIDKVPLLSSIDKEVLPKLVMYLKPVCAAAGDIIVKEGLHGNEMFFISRGMVEVFLRVQPPNFKSFEIWLNTLGGGKYFAEYAVMLDQARHPASIRAQKHCDMCKLERYDFCEFGEEYPITYKQLLKEGISRYEELNELVQKAYCAQKMKASEIIQPKETKVMKRIQSDHCLSYITPGTVITMEMRQRHREYLEQCLQEQNGGKSLESVPVTLDYLKKAAVKKKKEYKAAWKRSKMRTILQRAHCLWTAKEEEEQSQAQLDRVIQQARIAELFARGLSRNRLSLAPEDRTEVKFPLWMHVQLQAWKHRAQVMVAIRSLQGVAKRHEEKFNLKKPSIGINPVNILPSSSTFSRRGARHQDLHKHQLGKAIVNELLFEMEKMNNATKSEIQNNMNKLERSMKQELEHLKTKMYSGSSCSEDSATDKLEESMRREFNLMRNEMTSLLFEMCKLMHGTKTEVREDMDRLTSSVSNLKASLEQVLLPEYQMSWRN